MEKEEIRRKIAEFVIAGSAGMVLINTDDALNEFEGYCPVELEGELKELQKDVRTFSEKLSKLSSKKFNDFLNDLN